MTKAQRIVFLDLDDCFAGPIWPFPDRPRRPVDRAVVGAFLAEAERASLSVHLLTNRPAGQLPPLSQIVGGPARYHLAESGLAAWLPDENRAIVNSAYSDFASRIRPEVMRRLREHLAFAPGGRVIEEIGTRLVSVTVFPLGGGRAEVQALCERVRRLLSDLPVQVRQGKGVDIMPAGAGKSVGCQWAETLHEEVQGEPLDWSRVLYIEDSVTGSEAACYIFDRGGMVAAVANAHEEFRKLVAERGGILCGHEHEDGALEALRRWLA